MRRASQLADVGAEISLPAPFIAEGGHGGS